MNVQVIILLVVLFGAERVLPQSDRSAISGTVKDTSGAVVVGAQVVATNLDSNLQTATVTDQAGAYHLMNLPIGRYALTYSKQGFAKCERFGLNLAISEVAEADGVLTIGTDVKTTAVFAEAIPLQTQTSSISTNLNNAAITELPLNVLGGRNLSTFMFAYVPGVEGSGVNPSDKDFSSHINGSLSATKEVMIDGTSAVSQIGGYLSESSPPMEGVQEFQVTTAGIRADEGRTGGGVFRYEMKTGTNAWHGSGFLYMHNEAFDARSWGDE